MQNEMMMTGEVSIQKIDINTNEIYETTPPTFNDICWPTIYTAYIQSTGSSFTMPNTTPASGTPTAYWRIAFATYDFKQDIINIGIPHSTSSITNVGYPTFVAKTLPGDKDYVLYVADLLPDTVTRTIYGVGLTISNSSSILAGPMNNLTDRTLTNLRLTTPCIQDTSTVLRVTYKVYLDDVVSGSGTIADSYYVGVRNLFEATSNGGTTATYYTNGGNYASSFYPINTMNRAKAISLSVVNAISNKLSDLGIINSGVTPSIYSNSFQTSGTHSLTDLVSMGTFSRSLTLFRVAGVTGSYVNAQTNSEILDVSFASQSILPAGTSPVQNIFKQTSGAVGPFQDLNNLGMSTGTIALDTTTWTTPPYPALYKINIIAGGTSTTATYKIDKLSFTGGFVQNTYCPRDAIIPQDGVTNDSLTYHRNDMKDEYCFDRVVRGGTTIRSPDNNKYFVTASCARTRAAIAYYNIETGEKEVLNTASTPSLPVANVSDMAVSNGYTFVTCSTTGLWQIDPTFTTITNLTSIGAGVDSTKAYQIDVKANGDLWVLFEGGLCKGVTADSGATWSWSVYNTSNGFTAAGITNSNWANVGAMSVDPDHANDRILFVLGVGNTTTSNSASAYVWWERSTLTTTFMTTGISTTYTLANLLTRSDILKCVNGYWFYNVDQGVNTTISSYNYYLATWTGANPPLAWTTKTTGGTLSTVIKVLPTSVAGVTGAFFGTSSRSGMRTDFPSTGGTSGYVTSAFFVNSSNFATLPSTITATSAEFFCKFGTLDTITTSLQTYYNANSVFNGDCPVVYMGTSNMMVYWVDSVAKFTVSPLIIDPASTNYNTYKSVCWKSYGWDGSAWVLGDTNARTCHTTSETFLDGIKIAFANGGAPSHFIAGESFSVVVGDGLMKDNATDYTFKFNYYPGQVERVTDFYHGGVVTAVPSTAPGQLTDEYVNFSPLTPDSGANTTTLRIQKKGAITGAGNSMPQYIGDHLIPDNTPFTLKFKFSSTPSSVFSDSRRIGLSNYSASTYGVNTAFAYIDSATGNLTFGGTGFSTYTYGALSTYDTEISIQRDSANRISFYVGGVLAYSFITSSTTSSALYPFVSFPANTAKAMGFHDIKLTYFEPRRLVRVGNSSTSTGYFNAKYAGLTVSSLVADSKIYIDGVSQTIYNSTTAETITTNQVKIQSGSGWVQFNLLPTTTISTSGSTKGAAIFPVMAATKSVNKTVSIINAGTGYPNNGSHAMTFTGGGGSGAVGTVTISGGIVTAATVTNGGSGYTTPPLIGINVSAGSPLTPAALTAFIGYSISSVNIVSTGSGYTSTPTITFTAPSGSTGGHTALGTVVLDATKSVNEFVTLTNAGTLYTDGVYNLVFAGGSGSGAAGTAQIVGGIVRKVVITNGGTGYVTVPSITMDGATTLGTPAVLTGAIGYRVASINISDNGSGYISDGGKALSGYVTAHYTP